VYETHLEHHYPLLSMGKKNTLLILRVEKHYQISDAISMFKYTPIGEVSI
jgi:2-keto-3-deoxy-L-rhamnonate aldolase RhmA